MQITLTIATGDKRATYCITRGESAVGVYRGTNPTTAGHICSDPYSSDYPHNRNGDVARALEMILEWHTPKEEQ